MSTEGGMENSPNPALAQWIPGSAPIAVVMISLNEAHNMEAVLKNLKGWAQEVFLVDSYSSDNTVDIAVRHGVHVVQRAFRGFGDQWNFAINELPINAPWTMKLDPDERITDDLKREVASAISSEGKDAYDAYVCHRRLFFMERALPIRLKDTRVWRTGSATFSPVGVNEHALVKGNVGCFARDIEHHDSPDLEHWFNKQNKYTTVEAVIAYEKGALADIPRLFGTPLQRRMWLKKNFYRTPGRYYLLFLYHWLLQGAWRSGRVGYIWAHLRVEVMRMIEYKRVEIELTGNLPMKRAERLGEPDSRVRQYD